LVFLRDLVIFLKKTMKQGKADRIDFFSVTNYASIHNPVSIGQQ